MENVYIYAKTGMTEKQNAGYVIVEQSKDSFRWLYSWNAKGSNILGLREKSWRMGNYINTYKYEIKVLMTGKI